MSETKTSKSDDKKSKKDHQDEADDINDEKQVEKPLLESTPEAEVKQPKKKKMSSKKKAADAKDAAGGGDSSMFDITLDQLKELMQERGKDLMEKIKESEYGGVKGVLEKLKVDGDKGLDSNNEQDLEQRREAYGRNEIPPKPMKSFIRLCWDALHDMLLIILLVCAVVSIGLSFYRPPKEDNDKEEETNLEWIEGVAILVAVLVVVLVTAINDWRKERQFRGLESKIEKDQQTSVIRDGSVQQIPVSELVTGDLCFIKYGDLLPADGLIVQASDMKIDESSITGETDLIKKSSKEDVGLLAGTHVMEGSGRMLVVGVGLNSQVGSIMSLLGATGGDSKKKGKKDKGKDKKKDKQDDKKKEKKSKPISSSKVAPDRSSDDNEGNGQSVETVNETKQSSINHPRVRKLPDAKQSSKDEHEMQPTKSADPKESNDNKSKKSSDANDNEKKKSSSSDDSSDDEQKKKSVKTKTTTEQKKKPDEDKSAKKESSPSESSDSEEKKKTVKKTKITPEQKKKSTEDKTEKKPKKSSSNQSSDDEEEEEKKGNNEQKLKKSSSSASGDNEQKKKSVKTKATVEEEKKSDDDTTEKKESSSSETNDDQAKKKTVKIKTTAEEKKSSTSEDSDSEAKKKTVKTKATVEKKKKPDEDTTEKKESSSSESNDGEAKKKTVKTKTTAEEKKSSSSESNDDQAKKKTVKTKTTAEEKKSSTSEDSDTEAKKKTVKSKTTVEQKKKPDEDTTEKKTKKSSTNEIDKDKSEKKESSSDENSDDEEEKKPSKKQITKKKETKKSGSGEIKKEKTEEKKKKTESSSSEGSDDEPEEKSDDKEKTLTKTKSTESKPKKKSTEDVSDDEEEKKSQTIKQKEADDQRKATSSDKTKTSDDPKSKSDKKDGEKDSKQDPEKKPAGLAAMAEKAEEGDDEEGGSKSGKQKSVLQTKLTKLALVIGYIGMSAAVLTLVCLIIRFCITNYAVKKKKASGADVSYFISFLIQAITVVVVSVPEGLPLAVTLALAYAVRKMMTDNNLVRHLDACETMGNASTICSDKTGTLTTNRMTVVQCYFSGKHQDKLPKKDEMDKDLLALLFEAVTVNSNYTSKIEKPKKDEEGGLPKQVGNKTECALLDLVQKWGGSYDEVRKSYPEDKLVKVYTFNSARKMMSTVIEREDGYRVYTKGASEMVLAKCNTLMGKEGEEKELSDHKKEKITKDIIEKMANDGLRTICIAYKDLGKDKQDWDEEKKIISDLTCIGIVGIEDPVRDEVPEAIEKCQKAGVVVRMVTGDNITTARSIATKCGIIKPEDDFLILEGKEFNKRIRDSSGKISQKKLDDIWPKLRVLARSSPQDKYNLVNGIVESQTTSHREVVAVTGDGTNDGPALKRADVGFAMGIQGTDVAKQASDIILTDDNFSSIVKAMMWGRNVYDCIAKFLQFQLTANLSAGVLSVVCAAAISSVPLRAVQMLWVNLVMDTLASLALATEPPTEDLLNRKPYGRTKSIISPLMMRNIIGQSLYQLIIMFIILYTGQYFLGVESTVDKIQSDPHAGRELSQQFTLVFNAFVLMTLFNEINSRKLHGERNVFKGIHRNPFFYCIWIFCFIAQILIVTFGDRVFSCARLDIKQWAWSMLFGVGSLIWQQILLFIPIKPFSRCFSGMYRICCPCLYKRQKKEEEKEGDKPQESGDEHKKKKRPPKKENNEEGADDDHDDDDDKYDVDDRAPIGKYSTVGHLTTATVVMAPPPMFARFMLRKSVDRLNTEFEVISAFRSRLEVIKEKKNEANIEQRRNSQGRLLDE